MPNSTVYISQIADAQYFNSTHYIVDQRPDGTWYWTLTGQIFGVPFTIPKGQYTRQDKVHITLYLPGIGTKWVRLTQWAPYVQGCWLRTFQVLDPTIPKPAVVIECDCESHSIVPVPEGYPSNVPTTVLIFGYVVHAVGTLVDPTTVPD